MDWGGRSGRSTGSAAGALASLATFDLSLDNYAFPASAAKDRVVVSKASRLRVTRPSRPRSASTTVSKMLTGHEGGDALDTLDLGRLGRHVRQSGRVGKIYPV